MNEGPLRIPASSLLLLLNVLLFRNMSPNYLKFRSALFSIPTAPTKPHDFQARRGWGHSETLIAFLRGFNSRFFGLTVADAQPRVRRSPLSFGTPRT